MRLVSEIQFLLKFMLEAKKISHGFYSFVRKKHFYHNLYLLNQLIINNEKNENNNENNQQIWPILKKLLITQILSHNKNVFAQIIQLLYKNELKCIKLKENQNEILNVLKQNGWKKGIKVFQSLIA